MLLISPRQAAAKHVLESLQKFRHIRPRTKRLSLRRENAVAIARAFETIYHDLGVLTFSGLHSQQIERVGDILDAIKRNGGPGKIAACLLFQASSIEIEQNVTSKSINFDEAECDSDGFGGSQPEAMLARHRAFAVESAWSYIEHQPELDASNAVLQLLETGCSYDLPGLPQDIVHTNIDGSRMTDCEYYTAPKTDNGKIVITGHWFGNKERQYLGTTVTSYTAWRLGASEHEKIPLSLTSPLIPATDPTSKQISDDSATQWEHGILRGNAEREPSNIYNVSRSILSRLWKLEDETWAKEIGL